MVDPFAGYEHVYCADTEFRAPDGERVEPVCFVVRDYLDRDADPIELWFPDDADKPPPIDLGPRSLFVAYVAGAEFKVFMELGWPKPANVLDLMVVMRALSNDGEGLSFRKKRPPSLLDCLKHYGVADAHLANALRRKKAMREVILNLRSYPEPVRRRILAYCDSDVRALFHLLDLMIANGDLTDEEPLNAREWDEAEDYTDARIWLPGAVVWSDYAWGVADFERLGIPVDVPLFEALRTNREAIRLGLVERFEESGEFGAGYDLFRGGNWQTRSFGRLLDDTGLGADWPKTKTGAYVGRKETLDRKSETIPELGKLLDMKRTLSQLAKFTFYVGSDGRNRGDIRPFSTKTSRNAPKEFLLAAAGWLRGLVVPPPDHALAYLDWGQQEYGIAGALSGDENLIAAYTGGDIYEGMAEMVGFDPKTSRSMFKVVGLALLYGQTIRSMAANLRIQYSEAREIHQILRSRYAEFFAWQEAVIHQGELNGVVWTRHNWPLLVTEGTKERTLMNYMMQGTGADMLRLFCSLYHAASPDSYKLVAPLHDAVLIEAPRSRIAEAVAHAKRLMQDASRMLLSEMPLRTDALVISPDLTPIPGVKKVMPRFLEKPKHQTFWAEAMNLLLEIDPGAPDGRVI